VGVYWFVIHHLKGNTWDLTSIQDNGAATAQIYVNCITNFTPQEHATRILLIRWVCNNVLYNYFTTRTNSYNLIEWILYRRIIKSLIRLFTGICWGDPHIRTLDNHNFTFNGLGEYTLLQVRTENVTFDIQGRTTRPLRVDGKYSTATVFSAFAALEGPTGARVHFELDDSKSGDNNHLWTTHMYVNANVIKCNKIVIVQNVCLINY